MINPAEVIDAVSDSLHREEEIDPDRDIPEGAVVVKAIVNTYAFHPERLESHRDEVREWLSLLPHAFRQEVGGGWSFLQACNQEDGTQWTGEHRVMESLFALGIGLGLAKWQLPREVWNVLPGGMPYVAIYLNGDKS